MNNIAEGKLIIFEPIDFRSERVFNGHKKDINNLISKLTEHNVYYERFYCKGVSIIDNRGRKCDFNLFDVAKGRVFGDQKIMFSPLYRFRPISFLMRKRKPIYYVADSILKTSTHAFSVNPWLFYRLWYALIVENTIASSEIIVASHDEALWFSSVGHPIDKITVIPPLPSSTFCPLNDKIGLEYDLFLYHPNGGGVVLTKEILHKLENSGHELTVLITGPYAALIAEEMGSSVNIKIETRQYVKNLDTQICNSKVVIITDIGGSGLCNRSMHVRYLGVRLVSTLDGLRGTGLSSDKGVSIFSNAEEASQLILHCCTFQTFKIGSDSIPRMINENARIVKKLINKCIVN
jgi:hypothetical protein